MSERGESSAKKQTVIVTESPIDALSVTTLLKLQRRDWTENHYLSLGGTSPLALLQFLHDHPSVTEVNLCLDNDRAGIAGMEKIRESILADKELSARITEIRDSPPPAAYGKDYNKLLVQKIQEMRATKAQQNRQADKCR